MKIEYSEFLYPDYFTGFENLKGKDIKRCYEWYISQSVTRIAELEKYYLSNSKGHAKFDYTPESLIPLWKWFKLKIEMVPRPKEDIEKDRNNATNYFKEYIPTMEFSKLTKSLILDISYYFAEIMIRNNSNINWGFFTKPKNRASVNSPVLLGFKFDMDLDPRLIITNCAYPSEKGINERQLLETYYVWLEYI